MSKHTILLTAVALMVSGWSTLLASENAVSHPLSIVNADVYVSRTRTTVKLTCFAEDLQLLQGVEAFDDGFFDNDELLDATQDHSKYLAEKVILRDGSGQRMKPKITEIVDIEFPDDGIQDGQLMQYTISVLLEYRYDKPLNFLTVENDMVADGALFPSELKVVVKQAGSDAQYPVKTMKPNEPETYDFDWENLLVTKDLSPEEQNAWFEEYRKKNLGIESYSSVYSFIYISAHEVRHEVLIPLATLATLMELERADESFLEIPEQDAAAAKIERFFSVGNPVTIDSVTVKPVFDRIDFYGLDLRDFAVRAERRKVSMANGRVGIIMSYSTKGAPTSVDIVWDKFNNAIKNVESVVFAYEKVEKTKFSMFSEDNTYRWFEPDRKPLPPITDVSATTNLEQAKKPQLRVPVISTALLGVSVTSILACLVFGVSWKTTGILTSLCLIGGLLTSNQVVVSVDNPFASKPVFDISEEDAKAVFTQLHKNMYRAFDYHDENDIYDALAKSVDGELLKELYLDINRSLKMASQGGAVSHVNEVKFIDGELITRFKARASAAPKFDYRCKWELTGTIEHWGHIHQRTNIFDAEFQIELQNDAWKITAREVVDEQPGIVKTDVRKL